ncbi:MAG: matrixin family metalloprotease [Deltaproteobacteria bacterium]|nr:matrixin family metalloprotease [Deltaproteobacteria bacterium]
MRPRAILLLVVLLQAAPAASYNRTRSVGFGQSSLAWFNRTITWHLPEPGSADLPHDVAVAAAKRAFAAWAAIGCTDVNFTFVAGGPTRTSLDGGEADGVNVIRWRETDWPGAPDQIAITTVTYDQGTGRIIDVDIDLNGQYLFYTAADDPAQTEYDIESALLHEVGHLLGFDDSADPTAVMAQMLQRGDLRRTLGDDDAQAICEVYPAGAPTPYVGGLGLDLQGGCSAGGPAGTSAALLALLALFPLVGRRLTYAPTRRNAA